MTMSAPSRPLKRALLIGCGLAALGGMAGTADAQAFDGTPATIFGSVVYNRATPGVETVTINSNTAVIDWRPNSANFLPTGNIATFTNGVNNPDFVVLNRILSTVPMRFDGTVLSQLVNGAGATTTGGTVIFSSPGGLIVGATGVFDVGSLVLTTLNVDVDAGGNFYDAGTRGITLSSPPSPIGSPAVVTQAGAQLRALQPNSYIALIGPVVQHGGSTRVNGSAAYVAGEQVTFRANQGLFDIIVDTGSDVAIPLTHTGSTGGPANVAAGDNHAIYLVAMPKNQAITAVLQGDIGFDPAVTAGVENGVIVLSAGANIDDGVVDRYGGLTGTPAPDQAANFEINGGVVRSDLIGVARTNIRARPIGTPTLTFQQDVNLFGGTLASISVSTNQTVTVLGNALVSAAAFNTLTPAQLNLTGGQARIFTSDGGTIHIFGTATVDASARGLPGNAGTPGTGTGGSADVNAGAGGTITIDGALTILARGEGGISPDPPQIDGAAGTGGSAVLTALAGGTVTANGTVTMDATGDASFSGPGATRNAAVGTGGVAQVLAASGGTITIAQAFNATADGFGGFQSDFGSNFAGGNGTGGGVGIGAGAGTVTFNGSVNLSASGSGGAGPTGGRGQGGSILVQTAIGTINFNGGATGTAGGSGGDSISTGVQGGTGQGGTIRLSATSGTGASRIAGGAVSLSAPGQGGLGGGAAQTGQTGGNGGAGIGGSVSVLGESGNGVVDLGAVQLAADGTGGAGGPADTDTGGGVGGTGTGGTVVLGTQATANVPQTTGGTGCVRRSQRAALAAPAASAPGPAASALAAPPRSRRSARRSP
ncbi:beta strand repeat-containing protein [Allosphingosinicella sp.]|uniref:beta strand repeat-containing protein n=1 Tax=Allosphingosinicella sp. TaxID=2823234 RepID=UPI003784B4D8